jgi:hypothetical protein
VNGKVSFGKAAKERNKKRFCTYCGQEFSKCACKKKEEKTEKKEDSKKTGRVQLIGMFSSGDSSNHIPIHFAHAYVCCYSL